MKLFGNKKLIALLIIIAMQFIFVPPKEAFAATSPSLGEAGSFAVLAGTAITNVPTSVITGDIGLSPAAGSNITGLSAISQVSGTIFAVDASGPAGSTGNNPTLVNNAKTDLVSAYDALSAAPNVACDTTYAGTKDLVGESLVPGIYCADTFELSGTLTLTGSGVWIFRSAATLITSGTANVVGGDACNVWWKVVSSATLGTNTSLKGNILALTSITMNTGATLTGRALARNGAVTLDSNTINQSCTGAQPKATSSSSSSSSSSSGGGTTVCPTLGYVAPIIISSKRNSPTSVSLNWGPYSGTNSFIVQYGLTNGNWLYSSNVTGFSATLNDLPPNQPIWVRVASTNSCSIGSFGPAVLVGGAALPNGPLLPNTGTGSRDNNNLLNIIILTGIVMSALASLVVAFKKRTN